MFAIPGFHNSVPSSWEVALRYPSLGNILRKVVCHIFRNTIEIRPTRLIYDIAQVPDLLYSAHAADYEELSEEVEKFNIL
jgi:hypothetical protein